MRHLLCAILLLGCEGVPVFDDGLPGPPPRGTWIEIEPGGDTVCSRGTEYRFFARGGDPSRLVIDFQGGGACWDDSTCSVAGSLFNDAVGELDTFLELLDAGVIGGIFDDGEGREFRDYTIVHVPYCTGDIHWGDSRVEYASGAIEHRGFVNANAALEWVYSRYPNAQQILVSGCSAGAYGAALHSAYIADHYADARIAVLADSGAGVITTTFLEDSLPNWNAEQAIPAFIPALQRPLTELSLSDLYVEIGNHFPDMRMAQTTTQFDADQTFFYTAMGGAPGDWSPQLRASLAAIEAASPSFRAYVPPGSVHCSTIYPYFFRREVNGVRLAEWTRELVEGDALPETVACEGAGCCSDPICDECHATDGAAGAHCRFCDTWPQAWATCE